MSEGRKITFAGVSEGTGAESTIASIKAAVSTAMMEAGLPGAMSLPVLLEESGKTKAQGALDCKTTIMLGKEPGRVAYTLSGTVYVGGIPITFRGLGRLPKESPYRIGGQDLADFTAARAVLDAKKTAAKAAQAEPTEEELSAGESV